MRKQLLLILTAAMLMSTGCTPANDASTTIPADSESPETNIPVVTEYKFDENDIWLNVGQSITFEVTGVTFDGGDIVTYDNGSITAVKSGSGTLNAVNSEGVVVGSTNIRVIDRENDKTVLFTVPVWGYDMWCSEKMQEMAAAGVDLIQSAPISLEQGKQMLEIAQEYGIGVLCSLAYTDGDDIASFSDAKIVKRLEAYAPYPAFKGINIVDEPSDPMRYTHVEKAIHDYNPNLIYTTNFLPNQPENQVDKYASVIQDYGQYICFDNYVFGTEQNSVDENWLFRNFELYRNISRKYGLNFGFYIQAIGSDVYGYRRPDDGTLNYHCSVGLAYGATHYRYFSYFNCGKDFTDGIIGKDMQKTELYDSVVSIQAQLHNLGYTTTHADVVEVYHTGQTNDNYKQIPSDWFAQPTKRALAIVSKLVDDNGREYLLVVNKSFKVERSVSFTLKDIPYVYEVSQTTGLLSAADYKDGILSMKLSPGSRALFLLGK